MHTFGILTEHAEDPTVLTLRESLGEIGLSAFIQPMGGLDSPILLLVGSKPSNDETAPKRLDEIKEQILKALTKHVSNSMFDLQSELSFQLYLIHKLEGMLPDDNNIRHQLDVLEEEKYIRVLRQAFRPEKYSLTKKGRKYLVDNKLSN
jgi:hypothetical protein